MSDVKIARFVDMDACKSIFSDYSTFVLRSSEYYKRLYETERSDKHKEEENRGDRHELEVRYAGGGGGEVSGFVLSCWTKLRGDEPTHEEWGIFPNSVVAIISTPNRVFQFLEGMFGLRDGNTPTSPFMRPMHKEVRYADEVPEKSTADNRMDITLFTKRERFVRQQEYRFALACRPMTHLIDTYILGLTSFDYAERCLANPEMCDQQGETLRMILLRATGGNGCFCNKKLYEIIDNVDTLFPDKRNGANRPT